ncbi:hypothetical protein GGR54DRAFT_642058 [Hypoxylon sp. NC1633]|nr:hypothetical protein GGR54DRAFT_642058 [Hypoxylon sp. NC1633]
MPDALKKRKSCADEDNNTSGTAKKRKTSTKKTVRFVNISPRDTNTTDFIPRVSAASSPSLSIISESRNARDRSVTPTSVFSASEQGDTDSGTRSREESLSVFSMPSPCTDPEADCEGEISSGTPGSAASTDLSEAYSEPASLDMEGRDATLAVAPIEPAVPMELIHPDLRNDISSLGFAEATATGSIGSEGEAHVLTAIDEEEDIWEVEALLARWKQGRRVVYLVKWKGFPDEANTWQKRADINAEMVDEFDAVYLDQGGNHEGVELLDKRMRLGKVEYLVRWKGRPSTENSWEKGLTISYERVREFEARRS